MNPPCRQFLSQDVVNTTVALKQVQALEGFTHDHQPEMAAAVAVSDVTPVTLAFIMQFKVGWTEGLPEFILNHG